MKQTCDKRLVENRVTREAPTKIDHGHLLQTEYSKLKTSRSLKLLIENEKSENQNFQKKLIHFHSTIML